MTTTALIETFTGTFNNAISYRVDVRFKSAAFSIPATLTGRIGTSSAAVQTGSNLASATVPIADTNWTTLSIPWTPTANFTNPALMLIPDPPGPDLWFDSLKVYRAIGSLPDRWGFRRTTLLPVGNAVTRPAAQRIGDLYLAAHRTTPFRGSFNALPGGVRRVQGGASPHPAWLLADTGQLVRVQRIDPDTGAWGRNGTIAAVNYNHDSLTASVSLDENRAGFDTLLSRLAVVTGQRQT